jgi:hypothetical protein
MLNSCGQCGDALVHTLNSMVVVLDLLSELAQLLHEKVLHLILHLLQFTRQHKNIVWHG